MSAAVDVRQHEQQVSGRDTRAAPRFTSLIRAAKLVARDGEFVCVVRDVSSSGVRLRCFHAPPPDPAMLLALQNGESFEILRVREDGLEASFRFAAAVRVERLVQETWHYPRRPLRLNLAIPLTLRTLAGPVAAITQNISQQGCRLTCAAPLALAQAVMVESSQLPPIRARVRWRRAGACGIVFDDVFSLRDFALHAQRLQDPALASA